MRTLVAVKLYEMGRLSTGAAADLANVPKPLFLARLATYGVDTFDMTKNEIQRDVANARRHTSPLQYLYQTDLLHLLPSLATTEL